MTGQVALSFLLLAGAGLFVKSLGNLKNLDTGFHRLDNLVMFQVDPALNGYSGAQAEAVQQERTRAAPSVAGSHGCELCDRFSARTETNGTPPCRWKVIRTRMARICRRT